MNENTIKREDLEERFDDVDWKNYKVYAVQEAGKFRKETKYSVFWTGLHTYDGENVEAEIHISAETAVKLLVLRTLILMRALFFLQPIQ